MSACSGTVTVPQDIVFFIQLHKLKIFTSLEFSFFLI